MFSVAKISAKGQITIPLGVRLALKLAPGDLIAWDVCADGTVRVQRVQTVDLEYLRDVEVILGEWDSDADEAAYRSL